MQDYRILSNRLTYYTHWIRTGLYSFQISNTNETFFSEINFPDWIIVWPSIETIHWMNCPDHKEKPIQTHRMPNEQRRDNFITLDVW